MTLGCSVLFAEPPCLLQNGDGDSGGSGVRGGHQAECVRRAEPGPGAGQSFERPRSLRWPP